MRKGDLKLDVVLNIGFYLSKKKKRKKKERMQKLARHFVGTPVLNHIDPRS